MALVVKKPGDLWRRVMKENKFQKKKLKKSYFDFEMFFQCYFMQINFYIVECRQKGN